VDFDLSPSHRELQLLARRVAQEKIKPRAREIDSTGRYPEDLFEAFRGTGLLGTCIPEEYGGLGLGILGLAIAIEEAAKYSNAAALMLLLTRLATGPLLIAGSEDQKKRFLPPIAAGTERASFCLSEPQAGSDVMGMRTVARRAEGEGWVLRGVKCWISGILQADWYVVFAKTSHPDSRDHREVGAFIVRRNSPGVSIGRLDDKMGVRGVDTGELVLEDAHVPPEDVITASDGFKLAMLSLNSMRPVVAARGVGLAEGALMYAVRYLKERHAFGQPLASFQGLRWEVAKVAAEIEAARLLTYRAAWLADHGKFDKAFVGYLSTSKYYATELAVRASSVALQLLGAAGYMKDHPMELYYRDAKQLTIVEGTSQVQLNLIASAVFDEDLWWD
jgi:alkylation response protein AidB-like acyl-CoA dehydrogenase